MQLVKGREAVAVGAPHVVKVLAHPNTQKRLADLGFIAVGDRPEDFTAHVKAQVEALRPIVRELPPPQLNKILFKIKYS